MRESSIHIEPGKSLGYFRHNDRSKPTRNSIFDPAANRVSRPAGEAIKEWREEVARRAEAYRRRTGRKLHARTATHLSAIVNLDHWHTMEDVRWVADLLEERFGVKVAQFAIHRDEGYIDPVTGAKHINHHAHIEMVGIDEEGRSCRRKLTRAALSQLQTEVAELLNMPRGRNYAAERAPRPKRRDTYDYKALKQAEERERVEAAKRAEQERAKIEEAEARAKRAEERAAKAEAEAAKLREELAKVADVKAEAAKLREELREAKAQRPQYAAMEAEVRRLREQAKAKDLTIEGLRAEMVALRADLLAKIEREKADKAHIKTAAELAVTDAEQEIEELKTAILAEKERNRTLTLALTEKTDQIASQGQEIEKLKRLGERMFELINKLVEHYMPRVYASMSKLLGAEERIRKIEEELDEKKKIHFPPMEGYGEDPGFGGPKI